LRKVMQIENAWPFLIKKRRFIYKAFGHRWKVGI
jgi:hypothetical protein